MKNLKLVLVAAILSVAMISYAGIKPPQAHQVIKITLAQALTDPGMVAAMYAQLDPSFLKLEKPGLYSAIVVYNGNAYQIFGTRKAWLKFFVYKPPILVSKNLAKP
ncbi:MAG: hypothetical protein ABFS05_01935 [Bacteroidota bacterium]